MSSDTASLRAARAAALLALLLAVGAPLWAQGRRARRPAQPPSPASSRDAHRDSDRMRRRSRYEQTLDPTTRRGRPLSIPLRTAPVTLRRPPAPEALAAGARPYRRVLVISLDGLRPDAIALADTPNLRMLRAQGAFATQARTITHSYTLPSHTSMLSGVDTDRHGLLHNNWTPSRGFTRAPTAFYYAHDAGLATAMFVSKPKLRHIAVPGSVDIFSRPSYSCGFVVQAAARYLATAPEGLTFVHLSEPDEYGHSRGWMTEAYLRGVGTADACVGQLLTAIDQHPDRGGFLVLVTADHGGHGRTHGSTRDLDMLIPWIAWGSRVRTGDFADSVSTMDTAATALAALGVPVPSEWVGRPQPVVTARAP